ncbi:MAG: Bax inhibitor-1/YccA family protein [Candidatus Promineifilaceae bacterium]
MLDYESHAPMPLDQTAISQAFAEALRRVYLWMFFGLTLTAAVAWMTAGSEAVLGLIFGNSFGFLGLIVVELGLVFGISRFINRLSPGVALALFFVFAAINGLTMAIIFVAYELGTIALAFVSSAGLFGAMSFIGYTTKEDLSGWGKWLLFGLIGVIIASVVNMFLANSTLDWIVTYAGTGLFLALTVYDTQRIKVMTAQAVVAGQSEVASRVGVLGALRLYLDFINLFLFMLRILRGRRR